MKIKIPFFNPPVGKDEARAVYDVIMSRWMTFGKKTEEFEERFAKYIGASYVVMLDNATAAIHLACEYYYRNIPREARKQPIYTIGIPSLTCAATALSVLHAGINIEFVDLEDGPSFIMGAHNGYSIPVSYAGLYAGQLMNKTIVEDFAHRIEKNCFTGALQAYSFYATKNITTGEGGAIACATKEQSDWFKKARLFGNDKAVFEREKMYKTGYAFWEFQSEFAGWKANPTDIMAAMGIVQLKKIGKLNAERKRIAKRYNNAFELTTDRSPWHLYPILVNNRDKFMYYMKDNGVQCSVHFPPLHKMAAFKEYVTAPLPITERVYEHIASLPLYPYLTIRDQDYIIKLVKKWIVMNGYYELP